MRIRQYAYFAVFSGSMPATEITARLMIEPDKVWTRGSRRAEPPIPVHHVWQVTCDDRGMTVDEQVRKVVDRVRPRQAASIGARTGASSPKMYRPGPQGCPNVPAVMSSFRKT